MRTIIENLYSKVLNEAIIGNVASYIPELKNIDPGLFGITIIDINGQKYYEGDHDVKFSMQSISKIVSLLLALEDNDMDKVFEKVGMEPTGDPFNSIVRLETYDKHKPLNPMINAGAISIDDLIKGETGEEKFERILAYIKMLTGNSTIDYNKKVYDSEMRTGHRNRAMAYFLKDVGNIEGDVDETLKAYFMQCSLEVTTRDIAKIGVLLANDGVDIITKKRVIPMKNCSIVKSYMATCGMYDQSGEFAINVGIPAKSGVGGGIMCTVNNRMGIGVFGPALNEKGNSIKGINFLKSFSEMMDLSIY